VKLLQWINLFGVLALAALCVVQWQRDRKLNLQFNALEKVRQSQEQKIAEQERTARGLTDDLAQLKTQFQSTHTELTEARTTLGKLDRENVQLQSERDQLKASVTNWSQAVKKRDARLREANDQLRDLSTRLNDSIVKFNELATNYNASVKRFNDLATNYNDVVTQLNEARTAKK
jgi:DNA recombination protein RmuC